MQKSAADNGSLRGQIAAAYQQACEAELNALKPGNVHKYADGHGMTITDFVASANASVAALTDPKLGLGERIYRSAADTRSAVGCNTNLGILMLSAPLIQAALEHQSGLSLRERLQQVLSQAGLEDASWLFRAITLAAPAGLGRSEQYDVEQPPTVPLIEVMNYARERDQIARQYSNGFADLFEYAVPLLRVYTSRWQSEAWSAVALFLDLLKHSPDTHIVRKQGMSKAVQISQSIAGLAEDFLASTQPEAYLKRLLQVDIEFKREGINPGTTADLVVASLLILRLERIESAFETTTGTSRIPYSRPDAAGVETLYQEIKARRIFHVSNQ